MQVRYIRDWVSGSSISAIGHWVEIQALDVSNTNLAQGCTVTTSSANFTNSPSLLTDGNLASANYVGSTDVPAWVKVDLGSVREVAALKVWHYYTDGRTYYSTITEVSTDNANWVTARDYRVDGQYAETASGMLIPLWQTPNAAWDSTMGVSFKDFNRAEGNEAWLKYAGHIDLADAGGFFTTKNVESALQQLKTWATTGG